MNSTIAGQIRAAFVDSGLSVSELREKSGLPLERSALQRRLTDDTPMKTHEAEALARALGITIEWPERSPQERRPARSAPARGSKAKKRAA